MIYICPRCGYESSKVSNLKGHLRRAKSCPNLLECNFSRTEIADSLNIKDETMYNYMCKQCQRSFLSRQGEYKHRQKCLKTNKENTQMTNQPIEKEFLSHCLTNVDSTGLCELITKLYFEAPQATIKYENKHFFQYNNGSWISKDFSDIADTMITKAVNMLMDYNASLPNLPDVDIERAIQRLNYMADLVSKNEKIYSKCLSHLKAFLSKPRSI